MSASSQIIRLSKKQNAQFMSLVCGVAVLVLVFFLFVGSAGNSVSYADSTSNKQPLTWRTFPLQDGDLLDSSLGNSITSSGRGTLATNYDRLLVVYLYDQSDEVYKNNLQYFIQKGMSPEHDHIFIVKGAEDPKVALDLPQLPDYASWFYSQASSDCQMGITDVLDLFNSSSIKKTDYDYFVVVKSSVRGPFIPAYLNAQSWPEFFVNKLNDNVKLVGSTISCEAGLNVKVTMNADGAVSEPLNAPFVEMNAFAFDQVTLSAIEQIPEVKGACYTSRIEYMSKVEVKVSEAVMKSNHQIDSLMMRYQKIDWSDEKNAKCNGGMSPLMEFSYDGSSVHPFELIFVPMHTIAIENGWSFAKSAALYETWTRLQEKEQLDVAENSWITDSWPIKRQRIAYMESRGPGCFDSRYYVQKNKDLEVITSALELWDHFIMMGQFEGRSFRWSCDDTRKRPWE